MSKLHLSFLGQPQIRKDGVPIEIDRRKAIALVTYLAVTGERHTRDKLAGLLWPHEKRDNARAALRRSLTAVRRAIGSEWIVADGVKVGMNLSEELWLDVKQFNVLLAKYEEISSQGDRERAESLSLLAEVAKLYQTDFLSQFALDSNTDFSDWQLLQTENLRRRFAQTLDRLVAGYAKQQEYELAIVYGRRRVNLDPLHEPGHRALMRLYAASGQGSLAIHQFRECEARLRKELGVEPDPLTRKLFEEITARRQVAAIEPEGTERAPAREKPKPRAAVPPSARGRILRIVVVTAGAMAALAVAAVLVVLGIRAATRPITVAVLPLESRNEGTKADGLSEVLTVALIADLARTPRIKVRSGFAVDPYAGTDKPVSVIARELEVGYLVNGSIMRSANKVRIAVQLVNAKDNTTAWAEIYESDTGDLAALKSEVAEKAAQAIRKRLDVR